MPMRRNSSSVDASGFTVRFWGVRGSIPSPGPSTVRYGGNTSCVSVEGRYIDGSEITAIYDAGTGIRALSNALVHTDTEILLFLSHTHWDHIQGFPFFAPLWQPQRPIYLSTLERERGLFQILLDQMDGTRFPVRLEDIEAHLSSLSAERVVKLRDLGYEVLRIRANHPGETYGFRANLRGASLVYLPDNELFPPEPGNTSFEEFAAFCHGADVLIHDSQYTETDMPAKHGWGHSVISQVRELAAAAEVKQLVLFHHDPDRSDGDLDVIHAESQAWFQEHAPGVLCTVAYEGLEIRL